jgi:hypothetical protein
MILVRNLSWHVLARTRARTPAPPGRRLSVRRVPPHGTVAQTDTALALKRFAASEPSRVE